MLEYDARILERYMCLSRTYRPYCLVSIVRTVRVHTRYIVVNPTRRVGLGLGLGLGALLLLGRHLERVEAAESEEQKGGRGKGVAMDDALLEVEISESRRHGDDPKTVRAANAIAVACVSSSSVRACFVSCVFFA